MQSKTLGRIAIRFLWGITPLLVLLVGISGFIKFSGSPSQWVWLLPILVGIVTGEWWIRSIKLKPMPLTTKRVRLGKWLLSILVGFLAIGFVVAAIITAYQILQVTPEGRDQSWVLLGVIIYGMLSLLLAGEVILYAFRSEGEEIIKTSSLWGALILALMFQLYWFVWTDHLLNMLKSK